MEMLTRYPATMDCYDTLNLRVQFWLINPTLCFLTYMYNILKEKHKNEKESFPYTVAIIIMEK